MSKDNFLEELRDEYKKLHSILNINMSCLLEDAGMTTIEWQKVSAIECLLSLKDEVDELIKKIHRGEDNDK